MYKIYPIYKDLIDVFVGDGWEQWARVKVFPKGKMSIIASSGKMPSDFMDNVKSQYKAG